MNDFVVSARQIRRGIFKAEPGPSRMLLVPDDARAPLPSHGRTGVVWTNAWVQRLLEEAIWGTDERTGTPRGDILVYVHGYNNSAEVVLARHRRLAQCGSCQQRLVVPALHPPDQLLQPRRQHAEIIQRQTRRGRTARGPHRFSDADTDQGGGYRLHGLSPGLVARPDPTAERSAPGLSR